MFLMVKSLLNTMMFFEFWHVRIHGKGYLINAVNTCKSLAVASENGSIFKNHGNTREKRITQTSSIFIVSLLFGFSFCYTSHKGCLKASPGFVNPELAFCLCNAKARRTASLDLYSNSVHTRDFLCSMGSRALVLRHCFFEIAAMDSATLPPAVRTKLFCRSLATPSLPWVLSK